MFSICDLELSTMTLTLKFDLGRILFAKSESRFKLGPRFSESLHSVRQPESGFANPANPVLTWIR